jgi:uncharacterized protein with FMN-binding domain
MTESEPSPPQVVKGRKRKPLKITLLVLVSIIVILAVVGGVYSLLFTRAVKNIRIDDIDLNTLPDGIYHGRYKIYHLSIDVMVAVEEHRITGIELTNDFGNKEAAAELMGNVVREQSLHVDLVSGASASQKAALKAVEEALTKNQ